MGAVNLSMSSQEMIPCWSCASPARGIDIFCDACGSILPPAALSAFARFGLDAVYAIERSDLDARYFALQRLIHPDRFVTKSPRAQLYAANHSASVNTAYGRLKDPLTRAETLLTLSGFDDALKSDQSLRTGHFLETILDLQEELVLMSSVSEIASLYDQVNHFIQKGFLELESAFETGQLSKAAESYHWLKYLHRFRRDCSAKLNRIQETP